MLLRMSQILDECALKLHEIIITRPIFITVKYVSSLVRKKQSNTRAAVTQHSPVHQLVDEVV
jgi:hypothetical protein